MSWPNKFELSFSPSICMCTYAFHKLNRLFWVTFYFDLIVWAKKKPWQSNRQIGHFGANRCAFSYEIQNLLCHLVDAIDQKKSGWYSIYLCICSLRYQQKQPSYFNSAFSHSFDRKKTALKMGKQQNCIYLNQFGSIINWKSFTCNKFCPLTEMLSSAWNGNVLKIRIKVQMRYSRITIQQIKYTKSGIFAHKLQLCWIEYVLL